MRPLQSVVIFALLASAPALNAEAAGAVGVPLAQVAHDANLTYTWLVGTRAVQLNGPGIVLVVRPGDNLYEVNDRVEISADAPHYVSNDIYVSRALANHITHLARQAQLLDEAHRPVNTFSSIQPVLRIDHLFVSRHFAPQSIIAVRNDLTRVASDHLPLVATLELR